MFLRCLLDLLRLSLWHSQHGVGVQVVLITHLAWHRFLELSHWVWLLGLLEHHVLHLWLLHLVEWLTLHLQTLTVIWIHHLLLWVAHLLLLWSLRKRFGHLWLLLGETRNRQHALCLIVCLVGLRLLNCSRLHHVVGLVLRHHV